MITTTMFLASERDQDINDGRLCERQTREKTGSNSSKGFPEGNVSSKRDAVLSLDILFFYLSSRLIKQTL